MKPLRSFMITFFALCLALNLVGTPQTFAYAKAVEKTELISPEELLNPDGTLNLDGSFSGTLNLDGYNVSMDPKRGPVFSQANIPAEGDWDSLGGGGSPLNHTVYAVEAIGTDIYVGGSFTDADSIPEADYIAIWDGAAWHAVGSDGNGNGSLNSTVYSLHFDGDYLYVGGAFTDVNNNGSLLTAADYIARWNGSWSSLASNGAGDGSLNDPVFSITDDNPYLYVGGSFMNVNNKGTPLLTADFVVRWDGTNWSALGNNGAGDGALNSSVFAVAMQGTTLYAGGSFTNAGGNAEADYITKWNGAAWVALGDNGAGNGAFDSANSVRAIATDYSGNVYVGGLFTDVNNGATNMPDADNLVKWNGSAWSALGTDGVNPAFNAMVTSISFNGLNNNLYVGGFFMQVNNKGTPIISAAHIVKWDGSNWQNYGVNYLGNGAISGNTVWDIAWDGGGAIYVGGDFETVYDGNTLLPSASYFTYWDGSHWTETGNTPNSSIGNQSSPYVYSLAIMGTDVIVGGNFYDVDNNGVKIWGADNIAKWDGTQWSTLGDGLNSPVFALYVDGNNLYAGGYFTDAGYDPVADYIAKWDGTTWSALGSNGSGNGSLNDVVLAITKVGTSLYVGGQFTDVMDVDGSTLTKADGLARWDGTHWHDLANGAGSPIIGMVFALDTDGINLYVGGNFINAGGVAQADFLAKWDGSAWSSVGDAMFNGVIYAIKAVGTDLYVGGNFLDAAGIAQADYIAKWDGSAWSALGSNGADGALNAVVHTITYSNGNLYAGGRFTNTAGVAQADHIAKWNGSNWSALGGNGSGNGSLNNTVFSILVPVAVGNVLYAGGEFANVNNNGTVLKTADYVAAYGLDVVPPAVQSIARVNPTPTTLTSVDFTVTFSESVTGVNENDFSLTTSGVSSATVNGISGSGSIYTVTVGTGSGNGTIRLDVPDTATITDLSGNSLSGLPYSSGEVYDIEKIILSTSTITSTASADGNILESSETNNKGGTLDSASTKISLGDDAANKQYRAILSFDTSSLPDNAVITSATLMLKYASKVGTLPFSTHGNLMADIRKGPFSNNAALQTNDFKAGASKNNVLSFTNDMVNKWFSQSLAPANFQYINLTNVTQFRLRFQTDDNHDFGADLLKIYSGNAGASGRPKLIIEYYIP